MSGDRLTKAEYEQRFRDSFASVRQSVRGRQGPADLVEALDALDRVTAELQRVRPPAEVETAHRDYVNGIRAFVELKRPAIRAAAEGDEKRATELIEKNLPPAEVSRLHAARQTFERLGYDLGVDPLGS